jgi:hypothetical protein
MIFAFDPGPELAIERLQAGRVLFAEGAEALASDLAMPALLLTLALRLVRTGVDQRDPQLRAHQ